MNLLLMVALVQLQAAYDELLLENARLQKDVETFSGDLDAAYGRLGEVLDEHQLCEDNVVRVPVARFVAGAGARVIPLQRRAGDAS